MPLPTLYIGNKNYSSWSLRAWLLMTQLAIPFEERQVAVTGKGVSDVHRAYSPNGLVPCLHDGDIVVWETLAIAEYLYESHPSVWPARREARATARALAAEMHAGFGALRSAMPMNIKLRLNGRALSVDEQTDWDRICAIWNKYCHPDGPFLFGQFCAVDAMFAPVAWRLETYNAIPDGRAGDYQRELLALPAMQAWRGAALRETTVIEADDKLAAAFGGPR